METFKYGNYRSGYNHSPEVLNRVGNNENPWRQFWSRDVPQNLDQVRRDKALPLHWRDTNFNEGYDPLALPTSYTKRYQAEFKEHTEMYSGTVAPQPDGKNPEMVYPGGTEQIYIHRDQWRKPREGEAVELPQKGTILDESPLPQ